MPGTPGASQIRANRPVANNSQFNSNPSNPIIPKPTVNNSTQTPEVLRYPQKITEKNTDYVVFQFYTYDPPFGKGADQTNSQTPLSASNPYSFYNASGVAQEKNKAPGLQSILLYMPENIQAQYGARWGGADFSTAATGLARIFGQELPDAGTAISSLGGLVKSSFYDKVLKEINNVTGSNISLDQFLGSVSGTILNPNTEMLYQGTDLRTFSMTFKMTPKDEQEAKIIKKICNSFKKAMLPSLGGEFAGVPVASLLKVPNLCQVSYMTGPNINTYLPVYKLCAIAGVDVNYTPDGAYATYQGGSPVSTQLTVSFKETKLLFANDIDVTDEGNSF